MILADTSIWIDHLRSDDPHMSDLLGSGQIAIHPFIVAELALGMLGNRARVLTLLDLLPAVRVAKLSEIREFIESRFLYGKGIGLIDTHLIASAYLTPPVKLWTRDKRLRSLASTLRLHADLD
jgi:predicted nucleic acid-binding protein